MTPTEIAIASILSLPWHTISYILVSICSVISIATHFQAIVVGLCKFIGYVIACAVCCAAFTMFRWDVANGTMRSFGDVIISSVIRQWSYNATEEST